MPAHKKGETNNMAHYGLADILAQEIPDIVLMDLAFHWQANDNRPTRRQPPMAPSVPEVWGATLLAGQGLPRTAVQ